MITTLFFTGGTGGDSLLDVFRNWIETKTMHVDIHELFLLEGLLFISMLKFHKENKDRQLAEYLIGLDLLNRSLEEINT